jgi:predicted nuclease of predicted toxin-antitoxin system
MKFLGDVNLELSVIEEIRAMGYEVTWIAELDPSMKDEDLLALAKRERYILITNDKDFGELVFRQKKLSEGVILLRIKGQDVDVKRERMRKLLEDFSDKLEGKFVVVSDNKVRFSHIGGVK